MKCQSAIEQGNVNLPTGTLYGKHQAFTVQANGQLMKAADYRPADRRLSKRPPVRLEEIGRVIDSVQNDKIASWFNGNRGHRSAMQRQPGANTVEVVDEIKKLLPTFPRTNSRRRQRWIFSTTAQNRSANPVHDVQFTLLLTVCLVVLVIFFFLRNVSATMIPSLALPMSIIGTFAVMYLLGLQPGQPFAHGADAFGRLRGG